MRARRQHELDTSREDIAPRHLVRQAKSEHAHRQRRGLAGEIDQRKLGGEGGLAVDEQLMGRGLAPRLGFGRGIERGEHLDPAPPSSAVAQGKGAALRSGDRELPERARNRKPRPASEREVGGAAARRRRRATALATPA